MRFDSRPSSLPAPSPDAAAHSAHLLRHVADLLDAAGGWIGFDRYMEAVLYAPGLGYYTAGARKLGDAAAGGDFVTAPEISPLFAQALAAQLAQLFTQVPARILEFGAGSGALAHDLIAALRARGIETERYAIVEVSADLAQRQRRLLAHEPAVQWLAAPPAGFAGAIVANEVLDVLPVRLFVRGAAAIFERGVAVQEGRLRLEDRPAPADLAQAVAAIEAEAGALPAGYCSEWSPLAAAWTASLAPVLAHGLALIIDYGFPRREYYHPQRLMGTLMCHYRHHAHADPLWLPGLNDVTAHVDFTAVADAAHAAGLEVRGYTTQAHFLLNCGLLDRVQAQPAAERPRAAGAAQRLVSEAEMGELFKVLALGRGVDLPLAGFARGDRLHRL